MKVRKLNGEMVNFNENQFRASLLNAEVEETLIDTVLAEVKQSLYEGISTRDIYKMAFAKLKKTERVYAAKYSLKHALKQLGPTGFYFEKWISRLLEDDGFETITNATVEGRSVSHEADVIARKADDLWWIECKFRNDADSKITVTTPMYILSRFNDIKDRSIPETNNATFKCVSLVTNAYFTKDSIAFSDFYNIHLLAWSYPLKSSIKERVNKTKLYPVTCLTTLTKANKELLLKHDYITVQDLLNNNQWQPLIMCSINKEKNVLDEAIALSKNNIAH